VLLLVNVPSEEAVSTPKQGKTDSPNRNRPVVRGIATQLSSHTLVLVTAHEILDVLTPTAAKITRADYWEIADYWRYQRLAHSPGLTGLPYPAETGSPLECLHLPSAGIFDRTFAQLESNYLAPVSK